MVEWHFWMLGGVAHAAWNAQVSLGIIHTFVLLYIYSNSKLFISWHSNNEKIIVKKQKSPLTLVFKILLLRAFWSFSLCFIIIFYFIIFNQISNFFYADIIITKTIIMKIFLEPRFFFSSSNILGILLCNIHEKKKYYQLI